MAWRQARAPDRPCRPLAMPRHLDAGTDRAPPPVWRPQLRAWLPAQEARRSRWPDAQPGLAIRVARFRSRSGGFRRGGAPARAPRPRPRSRWISSCRRPSPAQLRLALDIAAGAAGRTCIAVDAEATRVIRRSCFYANSDGPQISLLCKFSFSPSACAKREFREGESRPVARIETVNPAPSPRLRAGRVRVGVILLRTLTHGLAATRRADLGAQ